MNRRPTAVVLASGGVDSTTALALARHEGFRLCCLSFDYGQRHACELQAARRVAEAFCVEKHLVFRIDLVQFGGSALTSSTAVPKTGLLPGPSPRIPATYVPARNTIFLSIALAWAEVLDASDIYIGVNAVDYSGYPDCRPEYIQAFQRMANLATRSGVDNPSTPLTIRTPLIGLSKADIIRKGVRLGVDYSMTHSCYDPQPEGLACGLCESCVIRKKGFADAGLIDPGRYSVTATA